MTARSNMKSTASVTSFPDTPRPLFWKARENGKIRIRFLFHTPTFPQLVENTVENSKTLDFPTFSLVEKYLLFQHCIFSFSIFKGKKERFLSRKSDVRTIFRTKFFFPQIFSHFSLFHRASFQEFPQRKASLGFYTKRQRFSDAIPIEKTRAAFAKKYRRRLAFSDFSNFSTNSITNTPKKEYSYFFSCAER